MKNRLPKLRIYRTSTSPYFPADFNHKEKATLETPTDSHEFEMVGNSPCDFLITNTHTDFSTFSDTELDAVKLIIHPNSGYDNFSKQLVADLKADVIVGNTIRAQAVAQYILSGLYHHYSPVNHQKSWYRERQSTSKLLSDLKVCIIGHGHIGKILSSSLSAMVKTITIIDPNENMVGNSADSDVVILACGLNFSNRHMINAQFLNSIKDDALIINAARGELINTTDLVTHLKSNPRCFAILDVFENEPGDMALFQALSNVITTSHIAGVYQGIDVATINFERSVITDFLTMKNFEENFKAKYQSMILKNRIKAGELI